MVHTSSAIALAAVVGGAASTMAAPTRNAPGDLTTVKKSDPYHIPPGLLSIGSTYLPRSDRREIEDIMELETRARKKKWAKALTNGGLDFAGNAIASSLPPPSQGQQIRELEERDNEPGILFLVSRANGVHFHITDSTGKHSIGASGTFTPGQSASSVAALAQNLAARAKDAGITAVHVNSAEGHMKGGIIEERELALREFSNSGVPVLSVRGNTPIPHDGCRPPKRRCV